LRAKVEAELRRFAGITQHYPALLTTRFGLGPEHTLIEVSLFQCRTLPFLDNVSLKSEQSLTAARADDTATAHGPNIFSAAPRRSPFDSTALSVKRGSRLCQIDRDTVVFATVIRLAAQGAGARDHRSPLTRGLAFTSAFGKKTKP
jgi:hypothetical protein